MFVKFLRRCAARFEGPLSCALYRKVAANIAGLAPYRSFSTIYSSRRTRQVDAKGLEQTKRTLLYVLRFVVGREHGFGNREDGYVSVKRLLNHPEFHSLDFNQLQNIVSSDRKHRFELEFDSSKGEDLWWLRAKQWNESHWVLKPLFERDYPGIAVFATTLEEWENHISRNGIPKQDLDWIEIFRGIPSKEYLEDLADDQQVFIFFNIAKCIASGLKFFCPTPSAQKWARRTPLVTKGNEAGYIPTSLFVQVELVTARKKLVWGDSNPIDHKGWVGYDEVDFDEAGQRKTYLKPVDGLAGFFTDTASTLSGSSGLQVDGVPGLREEAMAVVRS